MALVFSHVTIERPEGVNGRIRGVVDITLDNQYTSGGWAITPANLGLRFIYNLTPPPVCNSVPLEWDATTGKLKAITGPRGETDTVAIMIDADGADGVGTDVVVIPSTIVGGYSILGSTCANNNDAVFHLGVGGPIVNIWDDNTLTGGVPLYYQEDAIAGFELQCDSVSTVDEFVQCTSGEEIRINFDGEAAANGVQVYFDDNGGTESERMVFVSPSDSDGTFAGVNQAGRAQLSSKIIRCSYEGK